MTPNSPPSPGPDLFFAGGECLTRHGVWVRRTDMALEAATREVATRDSDAEAIGRDGILRTWDPDEPRAEWLNEVDLEATYNNLPTTNVLDWDHVDGGLVTGDGPDAFEVIDPEVTVLARMRLQGQTSAATVQVTYSCLLKKKVGASTCAFRILDGANVAVIVDPETGLFTASGIPDDFSVVDAGGGYWLCSVTETRTQPIFRAEIIPAWGDPGTLSPASDNSATGSNTVKQPQVEIGAARKAFQATPRDPDRRFPSLFLEDARTNGWTFSEELENAAWSKFRATVDVDAQAAPDGTNTADHITEDVTIGETHFVNRALPTMTANTPQSVSGFCRPGGRSRAQVTLRFGSDSFNVKFDFGNGTVGTPEEFNGASGAVALITALPDGWYRWALSGTINATATIGANWDFNLLDDAGNATYDGDGVSGLYLWGVQIETGSATPSSYIPTAGVTATRAADNFAGPFLAPPQEMTVYAKFIELGTNRVNSSSVWTIGNNAVPLLRILNSNGNYQLGHLTPDGSVFSTAIPGLVIDIGTLVELVARLYADGSVELLEYLDRGPEIAGLRSATLALAAAWQELALRPTTTSSSGPRGYADNIAIKAQRGVRSLDFMRAL